MRNILATLALGTALVGVLGFSASAQAAGDVERGKILADTCMGCHGIPGYRNAYPSYRVPKLGGQKTDYIVIALQGYRNGTRPHGTMHAQASSMTDQDMQDIAAFFASLGEPEAGPAAAAPGQDKIATCVACHGETGISPAPNWPNLAGQHVDYLRVALSQYKSGERKDPVMGAQAQALSEEDIKAVAAYFAAQSGLFSVTH